MGVPLRVLASGVLLLVAASATASAQERLCDVSHENCRFPLTQLIDSETVGIDVGVWFIKDARIPTALIRARSRGVPVRMIMDTRANAQLFRERAVHCRPRQRAASRCGAALPATSATGS